MTPKAYINHQIDHRIRIHIPSKKGMTQFLSEVETKLKKLENVKSVKINPVLGSVLIEYHNDLDSILKYSKSNQLFDLEPRDKSKKTTSIPLSHTWTNSLMEKLKENDEKLKISTQGQWDLYALAATGLVGLSVMQFVRGQWLPPAWTLLNDAYLLLTMNKNQTSKEAKEAVKENKIAA